MVSIKENFNLEEMAKVGLHFGHKTSKIHPKMGPFLAGMRNGIHLINLEKTVEKLKEALEFIAKLVSDGKVLLLVGTKIQAKEIIRKTAEECGLPYVNARWLGGTFTNFESVKKRVDYFKDLERKKAEGELDKYTKKERLEFDKKIKELAGKFGGVKNLDRLPDAIFVVDMKKDILAVREAKIKNIPVVAIADTSIDPSLADYPIPANYDAISSFSFILEKIKETI
ncbi:MAG: 30S ribosomal protein S2, partial [Candidatus Nealsonbacteria bacterium]|nr:30S ribosomal protein S2 [Candidatus Nealsonbacteria bacterium]